MIGVRQIERALEIVGASPFVKNGTGGVSVNLIAPSDSGKSGLMLKALPQGARVLNDVTTMTLNAMMQEKTPPSYLVVPDFNVVISHKPAVAELTLALLLALMGEGVSELHPGLSNQVKIIMKRAKKTGLRIALITGMTPEMFAGKRGKWRSTGFLRRLVPIHYAYTKRTQNQIQTSIQNGADTLDYSHVRTQRLKRRAIHIDNGITTCIRELSEDVMEQLGWKGGNSRDGKPYFVRATQYPFSAHKTLRQLTRATALLNGRDSVTLDDFKEVETIALFMRYDHPYQI